MTETKDQDKGKKLGLSRPGKLELNKTVETGKVRQSFSHGRSKMVTVEVKKKRTFATDSGGHMAEIKDAKPSLEAEVFGAPEPEVAKPEPQAPTKAADTAASHLTNQEKEARARALGDAQSFEKELADKAELASHAAAARKEAIKLAVQEAAPEPAPEPVVEAEVPAEVKGEAPVEASPTPTAKSPVGSPKPAAAAPKPQPKDNAGLEAAAQKAPIRAKKAPAKVEEVRPANKRDSSNNRRRSGKLSISDALEGGRQERTRSLASVKRAREREKQKAQQLLNSGAKVIREVVVPETIQVSELANRMAERGGDVMKALINMGMMVTINQSIDADTAELIVAEFGHKLKRVSESDVEIGLAGTQDDDQNMETRAPVVTVMGHVDHGKTSLLDALRSTDVADHEAGGITQHIGAYQVTLASGAQISFIDTPGHAAFTEMRQRGAQVTDIVVLCVAADDGVMPQTIEAIRHAKAAEVPIIVAINKIDKEGCDPNRVRMELLQHDIQVEEVGGDVLAVEVSALKGTNLDKLEEAILLQAELLDLKSNSNRPAEGVVVEAKMEQGRGSVATVLVQRGTLNVGDIFVAGGEWGRVRALVDAAGDSLKSAGPSVPVEILGLNGTPQAGDDMNVVDSEARAREVTEFRHRKRKDAQHVAGARGTLEQMFEKIKEGEAQTLPVVIKADVHGSLEAILSALNNMATSEVKVAVLHSAVGGINESDITLAGASDAFVIGFNVRANPQARDLAKRDGIDIRYYSIIYEVLDDIKKALSGMLAPTIKENLLGYAKIQEVFNITKVGKIGGCMVTEGNVKRGAHVRLIRDDVVIHEGELSQLKRFKDDVKEVKEGTECGMAFANYHDIQAGDMIECFEIEEVARELD